MTVVVADNRELRAEATGEYWSTSVTVNTLFALMHGYKFTRVTEIRLQDPELKALDWEARGHPWIKVMRRRWPVL